MAEKLQPAPPDVLSHSPTQVGSIRAADKQVSVFEQDGSVVVQVTRGDAFLTAVHITPDNKLTVVFDAQQAQALGSSTSEPWLLHAPPSERIEPEFKTIAIEGNRGAFAHMRKAKHPQHTGETEYYFTFGYHPDPGDSKQVVWYDVYYWGDQAKEIASRDLRQGQALEIIGEDHTYTKMVLPKHGGPKEERTIREIWGTHEPKKITHKPRTLEETNKKE